MDIFLTFPLNGVANDRYLTTNVLSMSVPKLSYNNIFYSLCNIGNYIIHDRNRGVYSSPVSTVLK